MLSGNTFDKADILRYQEKFKVKEFYIKEEERKFFINNLIKQTITILKDTSLDSAQKSEAASDAFDVAKDLALTDGFTEEVNIIVNATMDSIKEIMKKNRNVATLLKNSFISKESYSYKRTHILANLSVRCLTYIDWASSNSDFDAEIVRKIIYFSFFHDIYLKEESSHRIHSQRELNAADPSMTEKENILEHASKASELVRQFPTIPMGVDGLIANHHGVRTGMGFAVNYSSSLPPLLVLLIVVEDYIVKVLDPERQPHDNEAIMQELEERHRKPGYKKALAALQEVLSAKE